jgi:hypothetical protein
MKVVVPSLNGKHQTAFIRDRRFGDNILLAHEIFKNYHINKGSPRCAFKVDIMKAFNMVRWDFIEGVLKMVGFHVVMVQWIMECIITPRFSIKINGELKTYFPGRRGLRYLV